MTSRRRLRGHNYSEPGLYFLTVCILDRTHRLGAIHQDTLCYNAAGTMIERTWLQAPQRFPGVTLDKYCVMPNHFHGILGLGVGDNGSHTSSSVAEVMNWFKSATTVEYIQGVKTLGWPRFVKHLWLEGYHDHIIRDDRDLERVRRYIESNAANWQKDGFYT